MTMLISLEDAKASEKAQRAELCNFGLIKRTTRDI